MKGKKGKYERHEIRGKRGNSKGKRERTSFRGSVGKNFQPICSDSVIPFALKSIKLMCHQTISAYVYVCSKHAKMIVRDVIVEIDRSRGITFLTFNGSQPLPLPFFDG